MNKILLLQLLLIIAIWCNCTTQVAGGSSQQGNAKIIGSVVSANGLPAKWTKISVRPVGYVKTLNPSNNDSTFDAITDSKGQFSISGIYPGMYTIEANDRVSNAALIKATVYEQEDSANVGRIELKNYANITGSVDEAVLDPDSKFYVQVVGLERLEPVGDDGTFSIDDLPEGRYELRVISTKTESNPVEISGIQTRSGEIEALVVPAGWRYSRRFHLNTTETGVGINSDVIDFPVLIRLTSKNFDFDEANKNGDDIRFTKSDNTSLPYEIEMWDAADKKAQIWVKIDTIRGNDSTQAITIHWGNPDAVDSSDRASVFDTSAGFAGVWHLNDQGDIITDATYNENDGINSGSAITAGVIGNARKFTNGSNIRIPGLLNSPSSVTLSAWAMTDTSVGSGQDVISIGDVVLIRLDDNSGIGTLGSFYYDSTHYAQCYSGNFLLKTGWHYIVYTFDNENHTQRLFIDGIESAVTTDTSSLRYKAHGTDTYIGSHGDGKMDFQLIGQIDEVRVNSRAVSPDWIKLCYMNQKPDGKLIVW